MKTLLLCISSLFITNVSQALDTSRLLRSAGYCFDKQKLNFATPNAHSLFLPRSPQTFACTSNVAISWRVPRDARDGILAIQVIAETANHQLSRFLFSIPSGQNLNGVTRIHLNDAVLAQICDRGLQLDAIQSGKEFSLKAASGDAHSSLNAVFKGSPPIKQFARSLAEDMKITVIHGSESPAVNSTALRTCWAGFQTVISDFNLNDMLSKDDITSIESRIYPPDFARPQ